MACTSTPARRGRPSRKHRRWLVEETAGGPIRSYLCSDRQPSPRRSSGVSRHLGESSGVQPPARASPTTIDATRAGTLRVAEEDRTMSSALRTAAHEHSNSVMTRWRAPVLGLAALVTAAGCGSADALPEGVESAAAPLSTAYPYFDATGSFGIPPGWGYRVKATQPRTGKRTLGVAMSGRAVKMLDGGATLLAGEAGDGAGQTCAVLAKLDGLGDPDSNFGSLGAAPHQACSPNTTVGAIAVQSDGKVLVAGRMVISGAHQFFVARWTSTGGIDDRFGSGGVARFSSAVGPLVGYAVAVQPGGEIVVGGDYGLARFSAMGVPESTYGTGGLARLPGGQ